MGLRRPDITFKRHGRGCPQQNLAHFAGAPTQAAERRRAEDADAQEFHQIQKFAAACRRQWPGAVIVLRPDGAPICARAQISQLPTRDLSRSTSRHRPAREREIKHQRQRSTTMTNMRKFGGQGLIKLDDVQNKPFRDRIVAVTESQYGRPVLHFECGRQFSLYVTNTETMLKAYGDYDSGWIGQVVELYPGMLPRNGGEQEGVCLRPISAPSPDVDDETTIPF
jgi:hypothetical protein